MKSSSSMRDEIVRLEVIEHSSVPPVTMKECLTQFSETSVGTTAVNVSYLHSLWSEVVGKDIAEHVHVRYVKNNILYVGVDNPAWTTQLKYMHDSIIARINESGLVDEITSISVNVIGQKS